jgi:hypothetical protein
MESPAGHWASANLRFGEQGDRGKVRATELDASWRYAGGHGEAEDRSRPNDSTANRPASVNPIRQEKP